MRDRRGQTTEIHIAIGKSSATRRHDGSICTFWIWHCLNDVNKLPVQDIVDVNLNLQVASL